MGPVEIAIRRRLKAVSHLGTVPMGKKFVVHAFTPDVRVLLFGAKKTKTQFRWRCLENIPGFLANGEWKEIRAVHDTVGVPGSLDGWLKNNGGPLRTSGGYIAAVLEAAGIVEANRAPPSSVRLLKGWNSTATS